MRGPPRATAPGPVRVLLQLLPAAALCALFAAVGVIHVTSRVMVVNAGYRLSTLEQQGQALSRDNERLRLELATLKNPGRLERLARQQLGMAPPAPGTVISSREAPKALGPAPLKPDGKPLLAARKGSGR